MMHRLGLPDDFGALYVCEASGKYDALHTAAHSLLQEALPLYAGEHGLPVPSPALVYREDGKPFLAEDCGIYVSLSHCDGMAAVMLSPDVCGVDCEQRRPLRERVVKRVFAPEEQDALREADDPDFLFTRLWTLKESYVKAIGTGISYPMQTLCFTPGLGEIASNRTDARFWHCTEGAFAVSGCILR